MPCGRSFERLAAFLLISSGLQAYSVLTHEAIIDTAWDHDIRPVCCSSIRNPLPTICVKAHANAYAGCIIQDMGYYPFGSKFFSDLVHYVALRRFCPEPDSRSADVERTGLRAGSAGPLRGRYARPQRGGEPVGAHASIRSWQRNTARW